MSQQVVELGAEVALLRALLGSGGAVVQLREETRQLAQDLQPASGEWAPPRRMNAPVQCAVCA